MENVEVTAARAASRRALAFAKIRGTGHQRADLRARLRAVGSDHLGDVQPVFHHVAELSGAGELADVGATPIAEAPPSVMHFGSVELEMLAVQLDEAGDQSEFSFRVEDEGQGGHDVVQGSVGHRFVRSLCRAKKERIRATRSGVRLPEK